MMPVIWYMSDLESEVRWFLRQKEPPEYEYDLSIDRPSPVHLGSVILLLVQCSLLATSFSVLILLYSSLSFVMDEIAPEYDVVVLGTGDGALPKTLNWTK